MLVPNISNRSARLLIISVGIDVEKAIFNHYIK